MVSRAAHFRNKAKHSQRAFGDEKKRLLPKDEQRMWLGPFLSSLQGTTGTFNADSIVALQLGATTEERTLKLREASRTGVLRMSAYREDGVFVEYRWELTEAGTL